MEHRLLGRIGVSGSKFCLGAMMFGGWGNKDHDESIRIIHQALDAGINFIDTADAYSAGESEEIVGKALAGGRRDDVILATKVHGARPRTSTSKATRGAGSSARPRTRCGGWTPTGSTCTRSTATTPAPTSRRPSARSATLSTRARSATSAPPPSPSAIVEAQWAARDRGLQRVVTEQPPYSILVRAIEADVLPTCARYGMGVMSYSPLTGGWLSGRWRKDTGHPAVLVARWQASRALRPVAARQPAQA
jgi:aryl-alcohol dehydrogenase-like predicted oxidoreductase